MRDDGVVRHLEQRRLPHGAAATAVALFRGTNPPFGSATIDSRSASVTRRASTPGPALSACIRTGATSRPFAPKPTFNHATAALLAIVDHADPLPAFFIGGQTGNAAEFRAVGDLRIYRPGRASELAQPGQERMRVLEKRRRGFRAASARGERCDDEQADVKQELHDTAAFRQFNRPKFQF